MDGDLDSETPRPLLNIIEDSLVSLASSISSRDLHVSASHGKLVARIGGGYNVIHIIQLDTFELLIRVPAPGRGSAMTETAASALES